jgi:hypothetical protein
MDGICGMVWYGMVGYGMVSEVEHRGLHIYVHEQEPMTLSSCLTVEA